MEDRELREACNSDLLRPTRAQMGRRAGQEDQLSTRGDMGSHYEAEASSYQGQCPHTLTFRRSRSRSSKSSSSASTVRWTAG